MANEEAMTKDELVTDNIANLSKADFFLHFLNMTITESDSLGRSDSFSPESFLEDHMQDLGDDAMQRVVEIADRLVDREDEDSGDWVYEVTYEMESIGTQLREAGKAFMKISSMFEQFSEKHRTLADE